MPSRNLPFLIRGTTPLVGDLIPSDPTATMIKIHFYRTARGALWTLPDSPGSESAYARSFGQRAQGFDCQTVDDDELH